MIKIFILPLILLFAGNAISNEQTTNNTDDPPVAIEICDNDWGENNTFFKTDITITNNSDKAVSFDINFSIQEDSFLFTESPLHSQVEPDESDTLNIPIVGYELAEGHLSVTVDPGNTVTISPVDSMKLSTGAYFAGFRVSSPLITKVLYKNYYIMPAKLENVTSDSRFGVNGSRSELAGFHERMGLGWIRYENLKWAFISPEKDKFFFDGRVPPWHVDQDKIIKEYTEKHNLNYLPYVFQTPDWATTAPPGHNNSLGFPPKDFNDYGTVIFQIVARYGSKQHPADKLLTHDKVSGMDLLRVIELWNEPNLNAEAWGPWVGPIEDYFEIFRIGAEAAKEADPNIIVTSCGWAGINLKDNIEQMKTYRYSDGKTPVDFTDILNVHFYSGKADPEISTIDRNVRRGEDPDPGDKTYEDHLRELVFWWNRVKPGNKPIWLTETGYDVGGPIGLDERYQAAKLPRVAMIAFAAGIDKVFIYRERGSDPSQHAGAGFLRNDNSIRPSWFSYSTLVRQLNGVETGKVPRLIFEDNEKIWGYLWERDGEKVLAVWSLDDQSVLPLNLGDCSVTDSFGKVRQVNVNNDLPLGIFPVYISNISDMTDVNNLATVDRNILNIDLEGSGGVLVNGTAYSEMVTVDKNTVLELEAVAAEGWQFEGWSGDLVDDTTTVSVTMDQDKAITATFTKIPVPQYTLTIEVEGSGEVLVGGTIYSEPLTVDENTVLEMEAVASEGWQFEGWSGDIIEEATTISVTMDQDRTIMATFEEISKYTLTIDVEGSGEVLVDGTIYSEPVTVDENTVLELEAFAAEGWIFYEWSGDLVDDTTNVSVTMDQDRTITATFTVLDNIESPGLSSSVTVMPNPFTTRIRIENATRAERVTITSLTGKPVIDVMLTGSETETINTAILSKGIYFVFIHWGNDEVTIKKMVKVADY